MRVHGKVSLVDRLAGTASGYGNEARQSWETCAEMS